MKKSIIFATMATALVATLSCSNAQTLLFSDNFESGLGNWVNNTPGLVLSTNQNHTLGGEFSAQNQTSSSRMSHNLGLEAGAYFKLTYWLFDDAGTRTYGQALSYSGAGFLDGSLQQLFAIGKYHVGFGTPTGIFAGGVVNTSLYQGRIVTGPDAGWFNLPGVARTPNEWVKFDLERLDNGVVNFYVNDALSVSVGSAAFRTIDSITLGSVAAGTTVTVGYYDDVAVLVPEPSSLTMLLMGSFGLLGWAKRRRVA